VQLADDRLIFMRRVVQRNEMFSWNEQDMSGRLRADVLEREDVRILVNDLGRNLFCGNFTEQAVGAHQFPPGGVASSRRTTIGVTPSRLRSCSPNWRASSSPETLPTRTR